MNLEVLRQRGSKLKDFVIKQGNTELDGIGHGHFVGFNEKVVGQPCLGVNVEHSTEGSSTVTIAEMLGGGIRGEFLINAGSEGAGIKSLPLEIEKTRRVRSSSEV